MYTPEQKKKRRRPPVGISAFDYTKQSAAPRIMGFKSGIQAVKSKSSSSGSQPPRETRPLADDGSLGSSIGGVMAGMSTIQSGYQLAKGGVATISEGVAALEAGAGLEVGIGAGEAAVVGGEVAAGVAAGGEVAAGVAVGGEVAAGVVVGGEVAAGAVAGVSAAGMLGAGALVVAGALIIGAGIYEIYDAVTPGNQWKELGDKLGTAGKNIAQVGKAVGGSIQSAALASNPGMHVMSSKLPSHGAPLTGSLKHPTEMHASLGKTIHPPESSLRGIAPSPR